MAVTSSRSRRTRLLVIAAGVVLVAVLGTAVVLVTRSGVASGPECTVPGVGGAAALDLDAVQLQHAATINAVGIERGLPRRARIIALATAWQESSLRNVEHGDRDSVGLFQQRPSQGWGTPAQIIDPVYSSGKFYDALVQVPGWQTGALTEIAQAVQYSGFPQAYAKWETAATTLAIGLGADTPPELSCRAGAVAPTTDVPTRKAVPGSASALVPLRDLLAAGQAELGGLNVVSISGGGASAVVAATGEGLGPTAAARVLAAWTVAHATGSGVSAVTLEGRRWSEHRWNTGDPLPAGQVGITVGAGASTLAP